VERVVRERYNPRRMASRVLADAQQVLFALHQLPLHVEKTLAKLSSDDLKIQMEHRNLDHLISELDRSGNRIVVGMVMSALIIASALMVRAGVSTQWVTIPISVLWSLLGIWLIFGIFRSGRL
jgi:ubiquinone biosynthesis protein